MAGMAVGVVVRLFGAGAGMGDGTGARLVAAGMAAGLAAGMVLHRAVPGAVECPEEVRVATDAAERLAIEGERTQKLQRDTGEEFGSTIRKSRYHRPNISTAIADAPRCHASFW